MKRLHLVLPALCLAALTAATGALAQLVLPGAVLPGAAKAGKAPGGGVLTLTPGKAPRKRAGAAGDSPLGKPPGEEAVADKLLYLNGGLGAMEFTRRDKALQVKKLTFSGEQMAKAGESCEVSVALPAPLTANPAGQPAGLLRYEVGLEACPFTFDILEDAILLDSPNQSCEFKQAGCQVSLSGLWGPKPAAFTPAKAKDIERARTRWEAAVRAAFRDAVALARDKGAVIQTAKEQAGFSSEREEICRDYAGESAFGFCAARITQARAFALRAGTAQASAANAAEKVEKKKKK